MADQVKPEKRTVTVIKVLPPRQYPKKDGTNGEIYGFVGQDGETYDTFSKTFSAQFQQGVVLIVEVVPYTNTKNSQMSYTIKKMYNAQGVEIQGGQDGGRGGYGGGRSYGASAEELASKEECQAVATLSNLFANKIMARETDSAAFLRMVDWCMTKVPEKGKITPRNAPQPQRAASLVDEAKKLGATEPAGDINFDQEPTITARDLYELVVKMKVMENGLRSVATRYRVAGDIETMSNEAIIMAMTEVQRDMLHKALVKRA